MLAKCLGVQVSAKMGYVTFEILIAVIMKMIVFWDVTPNSLVEGTYYIHLQGYRMFLVGYITSHGSRAVACFLFARSEAVTVGSNPTQGMDVYCL
jgi:hypothetical protein